MKKTRVVLKFKTSVVIDSFASQKIARAIIRGMSEIYGPDEINSILSAEIGFTNLLPWSETENKNKVFFLPKPLYSIIKTKNVIYPRIKKLKKASFASENIIENYDKFIDAYLTGNEDVIIKNGMIFSKKEKVLWESKKIEKPYNQISRFQGYTIKDNGEIEISSPTLGFFFLKEEWIKNGGLYFDIYYSGDAHNIHKKIITSIRYLEDKGLGKKISTGKGNFEIEQILSSEVKLVTNDSTTYLLLSNWLPTIDELKEVNLVFYQIKNYTPVDRNILLEKAISSLSLKGINLITAGSIIQLKNPKLVIGRNEDIGYKNIPSVLWGKAVLHPVNLSLE